MRSLTRLPDMKDLFRKSDNPVVARLLQVNSDDERLADVSWGFIDLFRIEPDFDLGFFFLFFFSSSFSFFPGCNQGVEKDF